MLYIRHYHEITGISFILSVLLFTQAFTAQYPFTVTGTAPASLNGKKITLNIYDGYSWNKFSTNQQVIIRNGRFSFTGKLDRPYELAQLTGEAGFFHFALGEGTQEIKIDPLPPGWRLYKNKLSNAVVLHSKPNNVVSGINRLIDAYFQQYAKPVPNSGGLMDLSAEKKKELWFKKLDILWQNPDEYISLVLLYGLFIDRPMEEESIREVFSSLSETVKTSALGSELNRRMSYAEASRPGSSIPAFTLTTDNDAVLSNQMLQGKSYLLVFGTTWCKPCKENYPALKRLWAQYHNQGLEIISFNLDEKEALWKKQIALYGLSDWTHVSERKTWKESEISKQFNIPSVPYYIMTNNKGVIVKRFQLMIDPSYQKVEEIIKPAL